MTCNATLEHMSISVCPHCYRRVIPTANGTCPACGKSTTDLAGTHPHMTLVGLKPGDRLPPICHHCGVPTQNVKELTVSSEPQTSAFVSRLGTWLAHRFKPFGFIVKIEKMNKTVGVSLRLPTCEQCAKTLKGITPQHIDFDAHRVDLVVHTEFKKALEQNAPP